MVAKLPSASALAAIIVIGLAAGCGGDSSTSTPGGGAARLVSYHGGGHGFEGLSFRYPASWSTYHYRCASSFTTPIVYLSNERLRPPCTHRQLPHGSVTKGRAPLDRLGPDGVLVEWSVNGFPGWSFEHAPGTPLEVDGLPAKLITGEHRCGRLGADVGLILRVKAPAVSYNWYELRACIAGPNSASTEAQVRALISSTRFPVATTSATHPACSRQAATDELRERGLLPRRENFEGAAAVICHDFTGDGLEDMAFTRETGGSAGTIGWGIFATKGGGGWKLALFKPLPAGVLIKTSGDDLLRGAWLYRRQDGHCCPSGGLAIQRYSYDADADRFEKVSTSLRETRPDRGQTRPPGFG